jgi:hypothetical protein
MTIIVTEFQERLIDDDGLIIVALPSKIQDGLAIYQFAHWG